MHFKGGKLGGKRVWQCQRIRGASLPREVFGNIVGPARTFHELPGPPIPTPPFSIPSTHSKQQFFFEVKRIFSQAAAKIAGTVN